MKINVCPLKERLPVRSAFLSLYTKISICKFSRENFREAKILGDKRIRVASFGALTSGAAKIGCSYKDLRGAILGAGPVAEGGACKYLVKLSYTEKVKGSNCERIDQVIDEYTLKSAEKYSSFCGKLCVHNGPNRKSNICTEVDQQGSLVFQTKDDKCTITTHIEDLILNASNVIRYYCKKRPDATSIPDYLARTSNADKSRILRVLQSLKDTSRVHVRMIKGKESYFIGKSPSLEESHNSNEVVGQTYDSFLEILNGIDTPPEKDLPSNSQQTVEGSFPSSFIEIISQLVENNISLTNFLKNEKKFQY